MGGGKHSLLIPRWEPSVLNLLHGQWQFFKTQWPTEVVLMQVGWRLYAFNQQALHLSALLKIPLDRQRRSSFAFALSVPMSQQGQLLQRCNQLGLRYALVVEEGYLNNGWKRRVLSELVTTRACHQYRIT